MTYALLGEKYTPEQIASIVLDHDDWHADWNSVNAVAVALAESGGWTKAINVVDHDPAAAAFNSMDLGIWQVNTYWHPNQTSVMSFDPVAQFRYVNMLTITEGWTRSWNLWATWTSGAYKKHAGEARRAVNTVAGTDI